MQAVETLVPRASAKVRRIDVRIVVGLVLMVLSVFVVAALHRRAEARIPVLVAARTIEPGAVLGPTDVKIAEISLSAGIAYLPEARRSIVIGKVATERLWPGKLLTPDSVANTPKLPAGYSAMSLALKPERAAAGELRPGDHVAVIASASPDRPELGTRILFTDVPVLAVREGDRADGGTVIVTLRLRLEEARALAEAQGTGSIDLVLLSAVKG